VLTRSIVKSSIARSAKARQFGSLRFAQSLSRMSKSQKPETSRIDSLANLLANAEPDASFLRGVRSEELRIARKSWMDARLASTTFAVHLEITSAAERHDRRILAHRGRYDANVNICLVRCVPASRCTGYFPLVERRRSLSLTLVRTSRQTPARLQSFHATGKSRVTRTP